MKKVRDFSLAIDGLWYKIVNGNKTEFIMDKDWDNLIILDACRFDMFKEINVLEGKLGFIFSKGSSTGQFLQKNFNQGPYFDTVYVTSNPLVNHFVPRSFHKIVPVWQKGWYEPFQTVLPETMLDFSLKAVNRYSDKRLIFHFMQPHYPFIGKESREKIGEHEGILSKDLFEGKEVRHTQTVWHLFRLGLLDRKTVWSAYVENLIIVLKSVKNLLSVIEGKTVITSDHGNLFGERLWPFPIKEYGHFGGIYKKSIIKVPWLEIESGNRRLIKETRSEELSQEDFDDKEYKKKLKALGYIS